MRARGQVQAEDYAAVMASTAESVIEFAESIGIELTGWQRDIIIKVKWPEAGQPHPGDPELSSHLQRRQD